MDAVLSPLEESPALSPRLAPPSPKRRRHILPGFHLTLGFTLFYLSAIVLIPLLALVVRTVTPSNDYPTVSLVVRHAIAVATDSRAVASYQLSFGLSFAAALINGLFGFIAAWTLTRYAFPGKKIVDALIDLPFAMPTSVAGLALTQIFSTRGGYIGQFLFDHFGWRIDYTGWGILIALTFIGFPFVVRTLQPVLAVLAVEVEEAAACLGANRWQTFRRVILPAVRPALLTGVMLAFGRAVGEYGSIVFIYGTMPNLAQITPQLIIERLESDFDYVGAASLGVVMLLISFCIIAAVNLVQHFANRRSGEDDVKRATTDPWLARYALIGTMLAFIVLFLVFPVIVIVVEAMRNGFGFYVSALTATHSLTAIRLTLLVALAVVPLNTIFGICAAWAITHFKFPGKALLISLIEIPLWVSPVIGGLVFALLFGRQGWFGNWLDAHNMQILYAYPGIVLGTAFVTFPFVARGLIPLMRSQGQAEEEAALTLGANGWQLFWRITFPKIKWGVLHGMILCNARAMGEFGAVSVLTGMIEGRVTMPLQIELYYEDLDQGLPKAFALASVLLLLAVVTLIIKIALEWRSLAPRSARPH